MARGFIRGFLRGLGAGAVLLSGLSIYVGMNAQDDTKTAGLDEPDQGVSSQPMVQTEPAPSVADPVPEPTTGNDNSAQGDQFQVANLPNEPIIAQTPSTPTEFDQLDLTNVPTPQTDVPSIQSVALPSDPDQDINALPEFGQLVIIDPNNTVPQPEPLLPNTSEPQTPVLPLTPSAKELPSSTENNGTDLTRDYAVIETPVLIAPEITEPLSDNPLNIGRAIQLYASDSEAVDGRPLVALALVATDSINLTQLVELSYPVTVAISADHPDAVNWIEALRRRDQEVAITLDLAGDATVKDIETNLTAILSKLKKTVAVMEQSRGGLQQSRTQNKAVPDILSRSGHGLITYRNGLNSIQKNARNVNLSSAIVAENLTGLSPADMQRRLDRVLLEATKEGTKGALIVAPISGPVLQLISDWSAQDRAQRVQFVPVSQYLTLVSQD